MCDFARSLAKVIELGPDRLAVFGYARGVGTVTPVEPHGNLTGDPWFTDGLRAVMVLSGKPVLLTDIELLQWERPPERWTADQIIEAAGSEQ